MCVARLCLQSDLVETCTVLYIIPHYYSNYDRVIYHPDIITTQHMCNYHHHNQLPLH